MSSTALSEARHRFASALDELRRKYQSVFASWLDGALNEESTSGWEAISRQIALTRRAFIDEFIDVRAPAIVESLNPRAKLDVNRQLKLFEQDPVDQLSPQHELSADRRSRPGLMRTVVGAAVGAAVALLVLAQTNYLNSGAPADGKSIDDQRSVPPIKHRRLGQICCPAVAGCGTSKTAQSVIHTDRHRRHRGVDWGFPRGLSAGPDMVGLSRDRKDVTGRR